MKLLEYFTSADAFSLILAPLLAGLCVAVLCAVLSVLVVLKRLAFVGQGVSHSAFGGIGLAAVASVLAIIVAGPGSTLATVLGQGAAGEFAIIVGFCIAAALGMSAVGQGGGRAGSDSAARGGVRVDTGIGLFLVGSMAAGALLMQYAGALARSRGLSEPARSWESILFGSLVTANMADVQITAIVMVCSLLTLWLCRRPVLFYAFDETSAPVFGVPVRAVRTLMMVLLAVATVTAMKVCGVVLATALLVVPGAIALKLSRRVWSVMALSVVCAVASVLAGLGLSIELDAQTGPCIVLVLCAGFALCTLANWVRGLGYTSAARLAASSNGGRGLGT